MRFKISLKWLLLVVSMAGFVFSFILFLFPTIDLRGDNQALQKPIDNKLAEPIQSTALPEQASFGLPVRLKIPKIKVDAAFEYVGVTALGAVDTPKNQDKVAWFNLGPRPGDTGNAIITGHYGWKNKKPSVFDDLYKLREGDILSVEDENGAIITFGVRENRRYNPNADALEVFSSNDGKSRLNLITCEGVWDEVTKSYPERLVIFTEKESVLNPILW